MAANAGFFHTWVQPHHGRSVFFNSHTHRRLSENRATDKKSRLSQLATFTALSFVHNYNDKSTQAKI